MITSLSILVNNLFGETHRVKSKFGHGDKKCESCGIKYKYCNRYLEYTNVKDDLIEYKCFCCNKSYQRKFAEKLKKRYFNTCKFSNHDNNKFILLLWKSVYHYKYIGDCKKFNEKPLPEKKDFYSHLNIEDINDADYAHTKRVCKDFKIKKLGK